MSNIVLAIFQLFRNVCCRYISELYPNSRLHAIVSSVHTHTRLEDLKLTGSLHWNRMHLHDVYIKYIHIQCYNIALTNTSPAQIIIYNNFFIQLHFYKKTHMWGDNKGDNIEIQKYMHHWLYQCSVGGSGWMYLDVLSLYSSIKMSMLLKSSLLYLYFIKMVNC